MGCVERLAVLRNVPTVSQGNQLHSLPNGDPSLPTVYTIVTIQILCTLASSTPSPASFTKRELF